MELFSWVYSRRTTIGGNDTFLPIGIGGDSSTASIHGSLLKQTHNESVSTDLHALSRGLIPGGKGSRIILLDLGVISFI